MSAAVRQRPEGAAQGWDEFLSESGGTEVTVDTGPERESEEGQAGGLEIPELLPVLPLKNTVLFPYLLNPLLVNSERSKRLIDAVLLTPQRLMLSVAVRHAIEGSPGPDDLFRAGTILRIVKMLKFADGSYRLLVQGVARARIEEFVSEDPFLRGRVLRLHEVGDPDSVEVTALVRNVRDQFAALVAESARLSDDLQVLAANVDDPSKLADLVASNLEVDVATKQSLLEQTDLATRLKSVLAELGRSQEAVKIETEIREKVQSEMGKTQRDYMLRQQLEAIRRELGESEDADSEVDQLREQIETAGMSEEAHKQATRELERLAQTPAAAAEHGVIRTYLEWLVALPWDKASEDQLDVREARRILDEDHYDLEKVKDRIVEYIAVLSLKRDLKGPILCFVGPPGTGKTSLGRSIARALGREFVRMSLGGMRDEAEIRGHRRTYVGALPGRIIQGLRRAKTRNPVFLLDEIDKVGTDFRGDPSSALLEVLDPEQNNAFSDHYLEVPFDLSQVLFIATANIMDPVPAALRDRMEVIELPGYTEEDQLEIAKRFLVPRQREANGLAEADVELPDETIRRLIRSYTREAGVRNLEREIGSVLRKVARRVAEEGQVGTNRVAPEDLAEMLGPVRFEPEIAERTGQPGVAVGLAWTPAGGDILFVESTRMPGSGELKLTGSLGDVMRESAEAARSWLRSPGAEAPLAPEGFENSDVHLHVPAGAVPKDGPSAGVAMVTSLASLMSGRPARPDVAMTGEITLRGKVLPVGGVKEKLLAAKRAGIRQVVLPERNRRDVEEIQPELLKGLDLEYVGTIEAALEHTLGPAVAADAS
jgi:ATP-dependent Lon protease